MSLHDPTSIDPARFAASVVVEAVCDHVCELADSGATLREAFDGTLEACHDGMSPSVFAEIELALEAEGYHLTAREWDKATMIDLVQRVVSRLRG